MSKIDKAIHTIKKIDDLNRRDQWMNNVHPLVKLFVLIGYIAFTMATGKYDIIRMVLLAAVPIIFFIFADLNFVDCIRRVRVVLPIIALVGIINVFLDKEPFIIGDITGGLSLGLAGEITVRAGVISMVVLMLKGFYAVMITYIFIATTSIEKLCKALRVIKVPKVIVTQIMLTYRYISIFLEEVSNVTTAYFLRAPGQRGIHISVWGSLVGQMLLRTFDRADEVYESMKLRGYE